MNWTPRRRDLLKLGLGTALLSGLRPAWSADEDSAPIRVLDLDWVDRARDRAVPVRLYLPGRDAPVALMVFSHGLFGTRLGYSYLGRHVAEHGIASLHLQHVGSDRGIWNTNVLTRLGNVLQAVRDSEATARALDLRFALDRLLAEPALGERIDAGRIVAAGHSYGANTTLLATGAHVVRSGKALSLRDDRLRGALLLSAPPFYGDADLSPILGPVQVPSLHVTNTEDTIDIPGYRSPVTDRLAVFDAIGSTQKALAVFHGGGHSVFTDRTGPGGAELNARIKEATRTLTLAFLDGLFRDGRPSAAALEPWRMRHANTLARFDLRAG
ncbi:hypothetical protein C7444_1209 [Sphaerotilus hippei]|uniref:Acetylhydrolase n=1 Tax=Sphaerotilus hippei TaxID=744406 RepID=A0A318GVG0_9BURK|nr:acetylhydrolase [Sphaerotilus hippei]PXW93357.1 hypothetical protein C7444_1209 [Sphaerotilus hippei]